MMKNLKSVFYTTLILRQHIHKTFCMQKLNLKIILEIKLRSTKNLILEKDLSN